MHMEYTMLEKYNLIKVELLKQKSTDPITIVKEIMHKRHTSKYFFFF